LMPLEDSTTASTRAFLRTAHVLKMAARSRRWLDIAWIACCVMCCREYSFLPSLNACACKKIYQIQEHLPSSSFTWSVRWFSRPNRFNWSLCVDLPSCLLHPKMHLQLAQAPVIAILR
jgi:hypothetical protein